MKQTLGLVALLVACTGEVGSPGASAGQLPAGAAGSGAAGGPTSSLDPLNPSNLDASCTVDAPSPRRISRLSTEELLQSFALAGAIDGAKLPAALRPAAIPEAPSSGLAVTRDFHQNADEVATSVAGTYQPSLACDVQEFGTDAVCTKSFLATEGVRLLRGKSDDTLFANLTALAADTARRSGGATALKYTVRGLLLSPASLYMTEGIDGAKSKAGATILSSAELASYLSFRVSGRPPSSELLGALSAISSPSTDQLARIISEEFSSGSAELTARFLSTWLQVAGIQGLSRDTQKHPAADAGFLASLQDETLRAVLGVANDPAANFASLLTKPQQSQLLGDAGSAGYARWGRPGIFTLPGLIAAASAADHTDIPRRGRALLKNLLCETLQSPPPGAAAKEPAQVAGESQRARFERVGQVSGCGGCHARLHPMAFALEAYDELGAARAEDESSNAVDAAAVLDIVGGGTLKFDGPAQLFEAVSQDATAQNCFVLQTYRYVARRDERGSSDACVVKRLAERARVASFQLADLSLSALAETALSPRAD